MAIAWMYREDYARAGYRVLPSGKWKGRIVNWQSVAPSLALIPVALIPAIAGQWSLGYSVGGFLLGSIFLFYSARFAYRKSNASARQLLAASIIYLPAVFAVMMLNKP
jgi:heme o synthase